MSTYQGSLKRTINATILHVSATAGIEFTPKQHGTLNEKFSVYDSHPVDPNITPLLQYFAISSGALTSVTGADGEIDLGHKDFDGRFSALYNHVPFVMRAVGDDLSAAERENYAMRKLVEQDGTYYWAYYLKAMTRITNEIVITETTVDNGAATQAPFEPSSADLNPTEPVVPSEGAMSTDGRYYDAALQYDATLDSNDLAELRNVSAILRGDERALTISEYGFVAGYRQGVPLLDQSGTPTGGNYYEAIKAALCYRMEAAIPLRTVNTSAPLVLNLGTSDPAVGINNVSP